jgi:hypothetical protein
VFHVIGRNEVRRAAVSGVDIARFEGVHVLCGHDGGIITVYRNKNLNFRPRTRRSRSMRRFL